MYPGGMRIDREEEAAVLEVLRSKRLFRYYGPGPAPSRVAELEEGFARLMGTRYALAVASGTTALTSALAGLGVGPGDEAIIPAYTWIATAAAVAAVGAVPILAEVDETLTLDPADVEARITPRSKVIIPVHIRGLPSKMAELGEVAGRHGLRLLEDTAQADGASYRGWRLGSIGDVGTFSLQFNKIITAGEGGMVITNDRAIYERALMYHDVAASQRSGLQQEVFTGITCRMAELQAAVLLIQLRRLDRLLADMRRRKAEIVARFAGAAAEKGARLLPLNDPEGEAAISLIFYLPTAEHARYVREALNAEGVPAQNLFDREDSDYHVYYHWTPILEKRTWGSQGPWDWHEGEVRYDREMCPRTLALLERTVHLDVSPDLTDRNVEEVGAALTKVLGSLP
jgi:dTDP-4-amino-4,6-dideoxygalactose transaminase